MRDRTMQAMASFREWLDERDLGHLADPTGAVLTARRDYGGHTDPTCWRSGDIHELMLWIVPGRMNDTTRLAELGVAGLDAFLEYLEDTGRLHPRSMHVKALRKELSRVADAFPAAMADHGRWRMAKTLYQAMHTEGVDIASEDAVQRWLAEFNESGGERRRTVLHHLLAEQPELFDAYFVARDGSVAALRRSEFDRLGPSAIPPQFRPDEPQTYQPVHLSPHVELAAAARRSLVLRQAAAFVAWVGAGRPVDKKGRIPSKQAADAVAFIADRSGLPFSEILLVTEVLPLSLAMEWVELRRTGLVRGIHADDLEAVADGTADDDCVLRTWREALDPLVRPEMPDRSPTSDTAKIAEFMEQAEGLTAWALTVLYEADEPMPLEDLLDEAVAGSPLEDATERPWLGLLVVTVLRTRLHSTWRHGAVDARWGEIEDEEAASAAELAASVGVQPWYALDVPDLAFSLTPLGTWGVHEGLAAEGNVVPVS